ncbi:tRNA (adenosine(37)-N6)-threonylcarbamoyltransferase complex ATPase subunit type 1 TsaE [Synechococcus sp. Tobar12-5m-g]|jgi:tRNA threonylcarbamoyladenosine biosynthesis protein TsaE|uniref:tRNA (adenosine(37)-N6)-threonylcarbamoyltransferase complex ATPase subunit type 1 TsaE n=1 Tax=unclassified Synechococcus TaxID=2626047 RepID=UPI0020CC6443|nr:MULTISPECIES: tRNA (adenosine(37)-N6)-threonylcarbamoyltransferase complex ATPase subunit type 1 TsaE [unclassified Synechococcus]MCP9771998.1 tRNA (adenosine(37)-N6)-threonylcarbamoyltransferase complex ATPase subunit type 1 TsaE [Synechococcus sp. Tobar12-5m-g]MCP9872940.1 tRNA (adenosine(37)-N6)-threonylcarbamoyltransferase complex ATPase subunit type 1 TsaE [Synechococcus sp. Cruz CV-v-12]
MGIYRGIQNVRETQLRVLTDAGATRALGEELAGWLLAAPQTPLSVLLLQGELGAGKTCLVQGLGMALGIEEPITSPTFALAQHYRGLRQGRPTYLVHLDLYRLEQPASADELFAQEEEEARSLGAVLVVEWPERLSVPPGPAWLVELLHRKEGRQAVISQQG